MTAPRWQVGDDVLDCACRYRGTVARVSPKGQRVQVMFQYRTITWPGDHDPSELVAATPENLARFENNLWRNRVQDLANGLGEDGIPDTWDDTRVRALLAVLSDDAWAAR